MMVGKGEVVKGKNQTTQEKQEKTRINKIINEKGEVTIDNTEMQRIIRDYYEKLHANKMDNLEEMVKFLEKYNFPKLNQEEVENVNRPITSTEIKTITKNLPTRPGFDPWVGKIPWRRERVSTRVCWPVELHELQSKGSHRVKHN